MDGNQLIANLVLPPEILEWFDVTDGYSDESSVRLTLTEKDIPPLETSDQIVIDRKLQDITITDFPIRGKRTLLTFRRRYWKIEGQSKYLKRDIQLSFPGTKLSTEFAAFLKEDSGFKTNFPEYYS